MTRPDLRRPAVGIGLALGAAIILLWAAHAFRHGARSASAPVTLPGPGATAEQTPKVQDAAPAQTLPAHVRISGDGITHTELAVSLPDGSTAEETINLTANRPYTPTPAELAEQSHSGREVFGAKLSDDGGSTDTHFTLEYVVPASALPASVRERLYGTAPAASRGGVIGAAWAQPALNVWTGVATGFAAGKYLSDLQPSIPGSKVLSNWEKVGQALDMSNQYAGWMQQLDALEECARHPTHTLTQNAYQDNPGYQQQTIASIQQARSEVQQATGLDYVNQEANVAMKFTKAPGLLSEATGAVAKWNDAALKDIGNGLVNDAAKLVNCDLAPPPDRQPKDGTIKYQMHREGYLDFTREDHVVNGTFVMSSGPQGTVLLRGDGGFKGKVESQKYHTSNSCEGHSEITGGGASTSLRVGGNPVTGTCLYVSPNYSADVGPAQSDTAFECDFKNVDLVNGGSYEVKAQGEEAQWTVCSLELKPQQRN